MIQSKNGKTMSDVGVYVPLRLMVGKKGTWRNVVGCLKGSWINSDG